MRTFEHVSKDAQTSLLASGPIHQRITIPLQRTKDVVVRPVHETMAFPLTVRHIQDHNEANTTEQHHWAYPSRVLPCTNDAGTCAYLDAVYWMHDTSMLYTFILWGVLLGILAVWMVMRVFRMGGSQHPLGSLVDHGYGSLGRVRRRWLLRDSPWHWLFGRVSRLQIAVLACLLAYLLIFS